MKLTIRVIGMHCSSCVMRIEGIEDELDGVKRINASYQKGQMQVEFDDSKVTVEQIIEAVKRKGYEASLS